VRVRCEPWTDAEGRLTLCPEDEPGDSARATLSADASLTHVFDAETWEQAMTQYHSHMGWGPYKPW